MKKEKFLFEVRRGRQVLMSTTDRPCIYDRRTRATIKKAGCSMYLNGKPFKEADL